MNRTFLSGKGGFLLHLVWLIAAGTCLFQALRVQGGSHAFPDYIHGWTQSDRLAIAVNYARYQPGFLYPGTPNLNPRLEKISPDDSGISAMDLPLSEYISSWLMRLDGTTDPAWSRWVQLCFALAGLYALFRMGLDSGCGIFSLVPVFILLGSPAWLYYASGFIPSIPALSLALAGSYFFFTRKLHIPGILLVCLAGLVRTPLLIVLVAMFISLFQEGISRKKFILLLFVALLTYLPWFLWKRHLEDVYGSIFLNRLMPAESLEEWLDTGAESLTRWGLHLFSLPGWVLLAASLAVYVLRWNAIRGNRLLLAGSAAFAGGLIIYSLMTRQFVHHDYYYLDAFFVPLLLMAGSSGQVLNALQPAIKKPLSVLVVIAAFALPQANSGVLAGRTETGPWDRYHQTIENFKEAEALLSRLGIDKDTKVLVVDAYSTNAPLLLSNRRGYTILNTVPEELEKIREIPVEQMIIQDIFLRSDVVNSYPGIVSDWERTGGNGVLSVFRRSAGLRTEAAFAGIDCCKALYSLKDFNDGPWSNIHYSTDSSLHISDEFGPTFRLKVDRGQDLLVWVDAELTAGTESAGVELVFKLHQGEKVLTRQFSLNDYTSRLESYRFKCMVPFSVDSPGAELEFFIYNPAKSKVDARLTDFRVLDDSCRRLER